MKNEKQVLVPRLRFPEFRDAPPFKERVLSDLLFETKKRNRELRFDKNDVLSVSGDHGCVNQIELLGRSYAGTSVKEYHVVERGDIVYTKSPLKRNPYGIIKENKGKPGIVSTLYAVYRTTEFFCSDYLDHYFSRDFNLNSYLQPLVNKGAKNDMKVKNSDVLLGRIAVPAVEEQQKIADCLSSLDELIVAQADKVDALKSHKKGLMQQLFPREGESVPRLRFPEFRDAGEWVDIKLGQLGKLVSGLTYTPNDIRDNGLLVLRSSNIKNGRIVLDDNVYVRADLKGVNFSKPGDILICVRNGSKPLIGKTAMINNENLPCTHGAFMTVFRSKHPEFVYQIFQTEAYKRQVSADLGATINSINGNNLKKYEFCIPSSELEQKRIANCLSSLDALITAHMEKFDALKEHKKGLMQQLFPSPELVGV